MDATTVLIVDDQPVLRNGLRAIFDRVADVTVVGESSDGVDAVRTAQRTRPDIVLMDINMPRRDGIAATREICRSEATRRSKVVILTVYDQDEHVFEALRAGASGFILKDSPPERLVEAVRAVARGGALLSPSVTRQLIAEFTRYPAKGGFGAKVLSSLTGREQAVFRLLAAGYRNEEIAKLLAVGESTVKSHVQHLYDKLGVRDRVQVVIYAYEHGLVDPHRCPARPAP